MRHEVKNGAYQFTFYKACGKDTKDVLPPTMTLQCKKAFSCAKLANQKRCTWKFKGSLNAKCKNLLKPWQQNAPVRNWCRKSCRNCVGMCILFEKISRKFHNIGMFSNNTII